MAGHAGSPFSASARENHAHHPSSCRSAHCSASFYPEEETCHLCLLHPPGGIVGGDELIINAIIDSDCHTLITMPGASKFYRSSGAQAHLQQNLTLCNNATLEWLPQDSIFSRRSRHVAYRVSSVVLQYTAGWDLLCLGRPVIGETFSHGTLANRLEIWVDGSPLLIERLHVANGELTCVARKPWVGTMLFYRGMKRNWKTYAKNSHHWKTTPEPRSPMVY